jgi:hypothetical protein
VILNLLGHVALLSCETDICAFLLLRKQEGGEGGLPDLVQPKQDEGEGALDPAVSTHQLHQTMLKISPSGVRGSIIVIVHINDIDAK